jgi:hypothetical protein
VQACWRSWRSLGADSQSAAKHESVREVVVCSSLMRWNIRGKRHRRTLSDVVSTLSSDSMVFVRVRRWTDALVMTGGEVSSLRVRLRAFVELHYVKLGQRLIDATTSTRFEGIRGVPVVQLVLETSPNVYHEQSAEDSQSVKKTAGFADMRSECLVAGSGEAPCNGYFKLADSAGRRPRIGATSQSLLAGQTRFAFQRLVVLRGHANWTGCFHRRWRWCP